jgi:hypothetical protein
VTTILRITWSVFHIRAGFHIPEPLDPVTFEIRSDYLPSMSGFSAMMRAPSWSCSQSHQELEPLLTAGLSVDLDAWGRAFTLIRTAGKK